MLTAKANALDNPTSEEATNGPYESGFTQDCIDELETLFNMKAWDVVDKPQNKKILSSVWDFKRKRYPDGRIRKLKSRFCVRGNAQREGIDVFDTFPQYFNG